MPKVSSNAPAHRAVTPRAKVGSHTVVSSGLSAEIRYQAVEVTPPTMPVPFPIFLRKFQAEDNHLPIDEVNDMILIYGGKISLNK